jgi:hypothetical protein
MARSRWTSAPVLVMVFGPVLAGCPEASPPSDRALPGLAPTEPDASLACSVRFSPVPELEGATNSAASDWSTATGCDITVGPGGIPVVLADSIPDAEGVERQGQTSDARDIIWVHRLATRRFRVVLHEMGHALGGNHTDTDGCLSGAPGRRDVIDEAALVTVCSALPCPAFSLSGS